MILAGTMAGNNSSVRGKNREKSDVNGEGHALVAGRVPV
jgi:hypothetical protein